MKNSTPLRILSVLLVYIFLQTQTWALSGGPQYGSAKIITGTYSGVLLPVVNPAAAAGGGAVVLDANALGLFSIAVPDVGFAVGTCAFFNKGEVFSGAMAGVADPDEGTIKMLVEATNIRVITVQIAGAVGGGFLGGNTRSVGRIDAEVKQSKGRGTLARLEGTAVMNTFDDNVRNPDGTPIITSTISFELDGFKQTLDSTPPSQIDLGINIQR